MTIAGLISHLRWTEHGWFEVNFLGGADRARSTVKDRHAAWRTGNAALSELLDAYDPICRDRLSSARTMVLTCQCTRRDPLVMVGGSSEELAAGDVLRDRFGCDTVTRRWTEGRTIVAEGRSSDGALLLKATAERDVRAEVSVCRLLRDAGVSVVPEIVATGMHPGLPGQRWFVMTKAAGVPWSPQRDASLDDRVQASLAEVLFGIHRVRLVGFGELDSSCVGRWSTWADWVLAEVTAATAALSRAGYLNEHNSSAFMSLYRRHVPCLEPGAGSLLHADLDPGEIFIDSARGEVLGIVDWGDAIAGDPWMDLARFAAGGPADDQLPARLQPGLIRRYSHCAGPSEAEQSIRIPLYRLLWSLRHAHSYLAEPDEHVWTPGLTNQALQRLADLDIE